jgi:hypothetical protein
MRFAVMEYTNSVKGDWPMFGLEWNPQVSVRDMLVLIGFVLTIVGLLLTAIQLRRNAEAQKAGFLLEFTERYFGDSAVRRFFYQIDYNQIELDFPEGEPPLMRRSIPSRGGTDQEWKEDWFLLSAEERWLDSLLYTFDVVGHMLKNGVITLDEADIIGFQVSRVLRNASVERYLKWLDKENEWENRSERAHHGARYLAEALEKKHEKERQKRL